MFEITYNEVTNTDMGVLIQKRPVIVHSEEEVTTYQVAGRHGVIVGKRYRPPTEIEIEMGIKRSLNYFDDDSYEIMRWLRGSGELSMSDGDSYYRKVLYVKLDDFERETRRTSKFTATFVCDPYRYMTLGKHAIKVPKGEKVFHNQYDECNPVYVLSTSTEFSVNGNKFKVEMPEDTGTIIIDIERMIAFSESGTNLNTSITGDYDDGVFVPGDNLVITDADMMVIPQWRREE